MADDVQTLISNVSALTDKTTRLLDDVQKAATGNAEAAAAAGTTAANEAIDSADLASGADLNDRSLNVRNYGYDSGETTDAKEPLEAARDAANLAGGTPLSHGGTLPLLTPVDIHGQGMRNGRIRLSPSFSWGSTLAAVTFTGATAAGYSDSRLVPRKIEQYVDGGSVSPGTAFALGGATPGYAMSVRSANSAVHGFIELAVANAEKGVLITADSEKLAGKIGGYNVGLLAHEINDPVTTTLTPDENAWAITGNSCDVFYICEGNSSAQLTFQLENQRADNTAIGGGYCVQIRNNKLTQMTGEIRGMNYRGMIVNTGTSGDVVFKGLSFVISNEPLYIQYARTVSGFITSKGEGNLTDSGYAGSHVVKIEELGYGGHLDMTITDVKLANATDYAVVLGSPENTLKGFSSRLLCDAVEVGQALDIVNATGAHVDYYGGTYAMRVQASCTDCSVSLPAKFIKDIGTFENYSSTTHINVRGMCTAAQLDAWIAANVSQWSSGQRPNIYAMTSDLGLAVYDRGSRMVSVHPRFSNKLVAGDFALSAGWGDTATISTLATNSNDRAFDFRVTPSGTGIAANPTITLTWKNGPYSTAPLGIANGFNQTDLAVIDVINLPTTSTLQLKYIGTPVDGKEYRFQGRYS